MQSLQLLLLLSGRAQKLNGSGTGPRLCMVVLFNTRTMLALLTVGRTAALMLLTLHDLPECTCNDPQQVHTADIAVCVS